MSRVFAYCRVSTVGQTTQNQKMEIKAAGFSVQSQRVIEENISGSLATKRRTGFLKLLERLESGDILVVTKLDRLGRNAMDVRSTVEQLEKMGVRVHCLALGGIDLTSTAGKMTMQVIAAVAEFERDLLVERTQLGLARSIAEGKKPGRPLVLSQEQRLAVAERIQEGKSIYGIAKEFNTSRQTIMRVRTALVYRPLATEESAKVNTGTGGAANV